MGSGGVAGRGIGSGSLPSRFQRYAHPTGNLRMALSVRKSPTYHPATITTTITFVRTVRLGSDPPRPRQHSHCRYAPLHIAAMDLRLS